MHFDAITFDIQKNMFTHEFDLKTKRKMIKRMHEALGSVYCCLFSECSI